jgi:hypothetical protein
MFISKFKEKLMQLILPKNKKQFWTVFICLLLVGAGWGSFAHAEVLQTIGNMVLSIINWLVQWVLWLGVFVLTKLFALILVISAYNDFFNLPAVEKGWILTRDLCNMLFVVILLVIAFANIFRVESYSIKKTLPKLIFAAVAINFSKLICGLIIDSGQVIMSTFVNGYKAVSAFNLVSGLQLQKYITPVNPQVSGTEANIFLSNTFALLLIIATIGAMVLLLATLLIRLVYLWFLIIFSPIAFAFDVLPATQSYAKKWWSTFTKYVFVGPIIAFFLWLSLYTMANLATGENQVIDKNTEAALTKYEAEVNSKTGGTSQVLSGGNLANVAIAIAMLYGAFAAATWAGGYAGKLGAKVKDATTGALKFAGGVTLAKKYADWKKVKELGKQGYKAVARPVWGVAKKPIAAGFRAGTAPIRAPIETLIKAPIKAGRAEAADIKAAGGGTGTAIAAGVIAGIVKGFGGALVQSAVDGWRTAGLKDRAERYADKSKKVSEKEKIYRDGKLPDDALRGVARNGANAFADRAAAVITLAKNKDLKSDDLSIIQELKKAAESSLLYKNPIVADSLKDAIVKDSGMAHLYYDLNDPKQKEDLIKAFKQGKIKYGEQGKDAHENAAFDAVAYEGLGVVRYVKEKEKFAEQSLDNEKAAQKSLETIREKPNLPPVDVEKICAAIFKMSGDLQQTFTYQGSLQMDKMTAFVRTMKGKQVDDFKPSVLEVPSAAAGGVTANTPAVHVVQNIRFDALSEATNLEVKEKIVEAAFHPQIKAHVDASGTDAGKASLNNLRESIFKNDYLNQLIPEDARRIEAERRALEAARIALSAAVKNMEAEMNEQKKAGGPKRGRRGRGSGRGKT